MEVQWWVCSIVCWYAALFHRSDSTETGYALGDPAQRSQIPSPERGISPSACAVLRALMHSALLWASCNNEVRA